MTTPTPRCWIVKGNVRENDLRLMLRRGVTETWRTARPPKDLAKGDRVFFWMSAPHSRVVGFGTVGELLGWRRSGLFFFELVYRTAPLGKPLLQADLRADRVVGGASFLKSGPAGTLFPLDAAQAGRLADLVARANPELKAVMQRWQPDAVREATASDARRRARRVDVQCKDRELLAELRRSPNFFQGRGVRTLSVKQPWAWAILHGGKDIENRSKRTHVRGTITLHASASAPDGEALRWLRDTHGLVPPSELPRGAVVGIVDIVDCVDDSASAWASRGELHYCLSSPRALKEPIPAKGALGFWYWKPVTRVGTAVSHKSRRA